MAFGKQTVGATSAPKSVTLTNTGSATLKISGITVTGQFKMSSTTCHSQVAPAASCSISVTFSPQSQGAKSGLVSITDNASSKPEVIELSGTGD
jgi:archaellum component FlaF (FlaF/FlaG flagellin family)